MNVSGDDELIAEYLAESQEHLANIESDLLAMESAGASIDEQLVNRVFRAAHSIKGGAGFFNLHRIRELAHRTESILDQIRSRRMEPTPETVSVLLLVFDQLRNLLDHWAESNDANIEEYLEALAGLSGPAEKTTVTADLQVSRPGKRLIEVNHVDLEQARRGGRTIYLIEYDLIRDLQRKQKSPIAVLRELMRCGSILEARCDFDGVGTLEDEPAATLMFEVLYSTALEPELISDLVDVPPVSVLVVDRKGGMQSLAALRNATDGTSDAMVRDSSLLEAEAPEVKNNPRLRPAEEDAGAGNETAGSTTGPAAHRPEQTIRLSVSLLDQLMNLAGEMVLSRNQLNAALEQHDFPAIEASAHRLHLVTSEMQAAVAQTRMQPVGSLFAKFPRVVRDLARDLGKKAQLEISGGEVEIDKTILEGLSDPLTHMIRNAVDHGLEDSAGRRAAGKPESGRVELRASHQAGQVVVEIVDDGRGLDGDKVAASMVRKGMLTNEQVARLNEMEKRMLIFLPGVSTAEKLSDVSGRGVGMDVVKTNLDRLGGKIEIESIVGHGTVFRIKLPLTLAIIPSLLVSAGGQKFAIPQNVVAELIRVPAREAAQRIEWTGGRPVLLLREQLVPLVSLSQLLHGAALPGSGNAWCIVILDTGTQVFGLVVDALHDNVEIVVKPLGRHLKGLRDYAGATILGDGRVALILDAMGLLQRAGLTGESDTSDRLRQESSTNSGLSRSWLLFENAPGEACAVPVEQVRRIERVQPEAIAYVGGRRIWQTATGILPIVTLADRAAVGSIGSEQQWVVIVFEHNGRTQGLLAAEPLNLLESELTLDRETLRQPGISGSLLIDGRTTLCVDLPEVVGEGPAGMDYSMAPAPAELLPQGQDAAVDQLILVAEDSDFFRSQIRQLIEGVGYRTLGAPDGEAAWQLLNQHAGEIRLVATDVEMPNLDGLSLTRRIRADGRFNQLPIIALSSLAGEEEIQRGLDAGVTEYQVKLDPDLLIGSVEKVLTAQGGRESL